jgi:tetratricopeptide (TPR) repeat protein
MNMHLPFSRRVSGWALPLIVSCLLVSPRTVSAGELEGDPGDGQVALAEQKAAQAFAAYEAKSYPEAVALYIEAYQAAPNADMLFNLARIYDTKLGDRPLAINFYRRYIAEPGAVADRIQLANERLALLREAELAATQPMARATSEAPAEAAPAPAPPVSEPTEAGLSTPETIGVITGAVGVVALGVGTGFGVAALSETNTARDLCEGRVCQEQRGIDAAASASDHAAVSTVALVSGGALVAIGAALYFLLGDDPPEAPLPAPKSGVELGARLSPALGGVSVGLGGSW